MTSNDNNKEDGMNDALRLIGLEAFKKVVCADPYEGSSEAQVSSVHFVLKYGPRKWLEDEFAAYRFVADNLGDEVAVIFP